MYFLIFLKAVEHRQHRPHDHEMLQQTTKERRRGEIKNSFQQKKIKNLFSTIMFVFCFQWSDGQYVLSKTVEKTENVIA